MHTVADAIANPSSAGISMGVLGTGGVTSPMLPVLFAPTVVGFAAFGRAPPGRALLAAT